MKFNKFKNEWNYDKWTSLCSIGNYKVIKSSSLCFPERLVDKFNLSTVVVFGNTIKVMVVVMNNRIDHGKMY